MSEKDVSAESPKQDKWVFITEPERFGEAIKTMQDTLASIEIQSWYGDKVTPATKADFVELRDHITASKDAGAFDRFLELRELLYTNARLLDDIGERIEAIERQIVDVLRIPTAVVGTSPVYDNADYEDGVETVCACSECGCGGWTDFEEVQAEEPALTLEMLQAADAYTVEPGSRMPGAYSVGLAGDECGCELCRPRPF